MWSHTSQLTAVCFQVALSFILSQAEATLSELVLRGQELAGKLRLLQVDRREVACLKFLILFNPSESLRVLKDFKSNVSLTPLK